MTPAPNPALEATLVTLLGLMIGSFMNVCIYRLPRRLSPVRPRSSCTSCGHMITWYENIPILSYAVLRGRCRGCGAAISLMYPIVEAVTGAMFLGGYLLYGPSPLLVVRLLFGCAMIVLFVIDLQHKLLPNVITLPGIAAGLLLSEVAGPGWQASLIGALAGGGALWLIAEVYYRLRGQEGLGMGDVKMLAMIGAFLGWKLMLLTMVLASFSGSIVGVGVLVAKKESLKYALPFGTFLAIGALVAAAVGNQIVAWYLGLY
ncbi:MAG TPA: prepilin peptidase [Vicinamibacterales bacterium]|nr:prepilin peptidase [Vicinamibacterales bacterium]